MTFLYRTIPYVDNSVASIESVKGRPDSSRKTVTRKFTRDRRKRKYDRRKDRREGVIVKLSCQNDRRKSGERRKTEG